MTSNSFLENNRKTTRAENAIASNAPSQTYEELSKEFQQLFPSAYRAIQLIAMMYNRLTLVDKLSHKEAKLKIYKDHKHLPGFSSRNIRRSLTSLDNPSIPHRNKKIRPTWPNSADISEKKYQARAVLDRAELPLLSVTTNNHSLTLNQGSKVKKEEESIVPHKTETVEIHACPNCEVLFIQNQKLEEEKDKLAEGLKQALEIIRNQEENISEPKQNIKPPPENQAQTNNYNGGGGVLDCEVPLLYSPLQKEMASIFKLKGNKVWLTIRFNKSTGRIIAVYLGRESQRTCSGQSIMTSYV
jgi:hypothetical protein